MTEVRPLVIGGTLLLIGYLVVGPLIYLLQGTFLSSDGGALTNFTAAYGGDNAPEMIRNSMVYACGSTLLAVATGTVLAFVNVRTNVPFKGSLVALSVVPIIMPAVLYAPAWVFLASPDIGVFNVGAQALIGQSPFNIYGMWGMVWIEGLHLSPIVFLFMVAAFHSMDPSLEEAAFVGGAKPMTIFRRITLPLARPALVSGTLLVFVLAIESFEVPALIGLKAHIYVLTSQIYYLMGLFPIDLGAAGALSIGLVVVVAIGFGLSKVTARGTGDYQTVSGKAFRPRVIELGSARPWVGGGVFLYILVTVMAPVVALIYASLLPYYQGISTESLRSLSFDNYRFLAQSSQAWGAFRNSTLLAVASATAVMSLTTISAWFVVRSNSRGRKIVDALTLVPLVIPGLVLGLGLMFLYLRIPLPIYGTFWILLIAYSTRFLPFGMRFMAASMQKISNELEESAYVSGATWAQAFRRIVMPLSSPGIVAGWIFVLMVSFRELSSSILIFSPNTQVLSILIFQQYIQGSLTVAAATGVAMVIFLLAMIFVAAKIGARMGTKSD